MGSSWMSSYVGPRAYFYHEGTSYCVPFRWVKEERVSLHLESPGTTVLPWITLICSQFASQVQWSGFYLKLQEKDALGRRHFLSFNSWVMWVWRAWWKPVSQHVFSLIPPQARLFYCPATTWVHLCREGKRQRKIKSRTEETFLPTSEHLHRLAAIDMYQSPSALLIPQELLKINWLVVFHRGNHVSRLSIYSVFIRINFRAR